MTADRIRRVVADAERIRPSFGPGLHASTRQAALRAADALDVVAGMADEGDLRYGLWWYVLEEWALELAEHARAVHQGLLAATPAVAP